MDLVWLGVGFAVGALMVWIYFNFRNKRQEAEYQAQLARERSKFQETIDQKEKEHQYAMRRLSGLESEYAKAAEQTTALSSDLRTCSSRLDSERTSHLQTKQRLSQSEADRSNAIARSDAIQSELQEAILRFENQRTSESGAGDRLAKLQTENDNLEERLNEEQISRGRFETQLREAQAALSSASNENQSRIEQLEEGLQERNEKIQQLESELASRAVTPESQPSSTPENTQSEPAQDVPDQAKPSEVAISATESDADVDDLTRIKGIGPVLKQKLNTLGITSFRQIADFKETEIAHINGMLDFPGRIERENWIKQARELASQSAQ